ncbi:unnamed protein product, partial [Symbiodinium sp. CCMP2592]
VTEHLGRGRHWYRKYELLEKIKEDAVVELKSELKFARMSEDFQHQLFFRFLTVPPQERAVHKAMDFNEQQAQLTDKLDKTNLVVAAQDRDIVRKRQE